MTPAENTSIAARSGGQPVRSRSATSLRTLTWVLWPVMAAIYYFVLSSPIPALVRLVPLEILYCSPILVTVAFSYMAYRRSEEVERVFWAALGSANAVLFGCEVLLVFWVYAVDPAGPPRVSWPFHIMHGIAAASFITLLLAMSRFGRSTTATKLRWALDASAAVMIIGVVITELYSRPIMEPAGASIGEVLLGTGYPLFGFVMLMGTLGNVVGFKVDRWRAWDRLVTISLAVYAVAISLWPMWYPTALDTSRNYERGVLDLVQFGGHWLLMAATVYRLTDDSGWRIRPLPPIVTTRRWVSLALPASSVVAIPSILWLGLTVHKDSAWLYVYAAAASILTLLVLARSIALSLEHGVLFHRSITDPLTGVYNHRFFHDHLAEQIDRGRRYSEPVALLAFDIDEFGAFNERYGHLSGDRLLCEIAGIMQSACPAMCTVSRLGGDEFAIVAPDTDVVAASLLAARLLDMISIEAGTSPGTVSVSIGVAVYPDHATEGEQLYRLADGALFHSKDNGKARVTMFDDDRVPDLSARERMERLEHQSRLASVRALAAAADARDMTVHDHSRSVAHLAVRIARALDVDGAVLRRIETGGPLYDIGRLALADADESASLGDDERRHAVLGQQILTTSGLGDFAAMARSHHEHWNGGGYPDGLASTEIPVEARIIAVADAYDMLISGLAPGIARTRARALEEIDAEAGTRFDPDVVAALRTVVGERAVTAHASAS